MGVHKYKYNWDFFEIDSEMLYYFLGFVAADGYISEDSIEIALNKKDEELLIKFRDAIVPDKPVNDKKVSNAKVLKLGMKSKIKDFKKFYGMTTSKKHDEIVFPNIKDEYVKHFIRGYIDGDGTIDTTKGYRDDKVYIGPRLRILGNESFLKILNAKTKEVYFHRTNAITKKGKENVYYISYNFSTAKNILDWLYKDATIYLERKYNKYLEICYKDEDIV